MNISKEKEIKDMEYISDTDTLVVNKEDIKTLDVITDLFEYGFDSYDLSSLLTVIEEKKKKYGIMNIKYKDD